MARTINPVSAAPVSEKPLTAVLVSPRPWVKWVLIFGVSTLFILITSTIVNVGQRAGLFPNMPPIPWYRAFLEQAALWYLTALLAPEILSCGGRFRLERASWPWALPLHL